MKYGRPARCDQSGPRLRWQPAKTEVIPPCRRSRTPGCRTCRTYPGSAGRTDGQSSRVPATIWMPAGCRYDSNLQTFLQQLRDAPDLAAVLAKTVVWMRGLVSAPGLSEGIAQEMAQLLEMLRMDQEGFQRFFLNQSRRGTDFPDRCSPCSDRHIRTCPAKGCGRLFLILQSAMEIFRRSSTWQRI